MQIYVKIATFVNKNLINDFYYDIIEVIKKEDLWQNIVLTVVLN